MYLFRDLSVKHDDAHDEPMKTEEKPNATHASALDTILKVLDIDYKL